MKLRNELTNENTSKQCKAVHSHICCGEETLAFSYSERRHSGVSTVDGERVKRSCWKGWIKMDGEFLGPDSLY